MSGEASGVFFHEIFGHRMEGHRMKSGGQTFRNMVGTKVLPEDFQVYCDPTLTRYGKQLLNGGYHYDEEGVKARRVNNVVDGILKEFLMSRIPLDSFPQSNGHGRAARGRNAVSRQSNLLSFPKRNRWLHRYGRPWRNQLVQYYAIGSISYLCRWSSRRTGERRRSHRNAIDNVLTHSSRRRYALYLHWHVRSGIGMGACLGNFTHVIRRYHRDTTSPTNEHVETFA